MKTKQPILLDFEEAYGKQIVKCWFKGVKLKNVRASYTVMNGRILISICGEPCKTIRKKKK